MVTGRTLLVKYIIFLILSKAVLVYESISLSVKTITSLCEQQHFCISKNQEDNKYFQVIKKISHQP